MKKDYIIPVMEQIEVRPWQPLMMVSGSGEPAISGDNIGYDGPGGSFGPDEEVASPLQHILGDF